jgi:hypothetical protein
LQVGVGSPATTYDLIVDTGSSNTWVGAGKAYVKTSTSKQTSNRVSVTYGSGSFSGNEFTDQVSLGSGLTITGQVTATLFCIYESRVSPVTHSRSALRLAAPDSTA